MDIKKKGAKPKRHTYNHFIWYYRSLIVASTGILIYLYLSPRTWGSPSFSQQEQACTNRACIKILSFNVQNAQDTFHNIWGCPVEISRRDSILQKNPSRTLEDVETQLTMERYHRITFFLKAHKENGVTAIALQEVSQSIPSLLDIFDPNDSPWKIACKGGDSALLIDTTYIHILHTETYSKPIQGCSANVLYFPNTISERIKLDLESSANHQDVANENTYHHLTLATTHLTAGDIRSSETVDQTLETLLSTVSNNVPVIFCGDFNAHLPELRTRVHKMHNSRVEGKDWQIATVQNKSKVEPLFFTTQHEFNWLGAFDGFMYRGLNALHVDAIEVGFMPKYMGIDGAFSYVEEELIYLQIQNMQPKDTSYTAKRIVENSAGSNSYSDHLPVIGTFLIL